MWLLYGSIVCVYGNIKSEFYLLQPEERMQNFTLIYDWSSRASSEVQFLCLLHSK